MVRIHRMLAISQFALRSCVLIVTFTHISRIWVLWIRVSGSAVCLVSQNDSHADHSGSAVSGIPSAVPLYPWHRVTRCPQK